MNLSGEAQRVLTLSLPGNWQLESKDAGAELKSLGQGQYQLTAPQNATELKLTAKF